MGKTTTAVNLATALSADQRILLIDLDPQGNASTGLGIQRIDRHVGTYAMLIDGAPFDYVAQGTCVPNLSLIPADPISPGPRWNWRRIEERERRLRECLRAGRGARGIRLRLPRLPPSLGLLTVNALVAAGSVLVPLQCEFYALEGVSQIAQTIERVRHALNPALGMEGIVLTMYDGGTTCRKPSRRMCAALRREGVRDGDPEEYPGQRGAIPRPARHPLRLPLPRCPGLREAGCRTSPTRASSSRDSSPAVTRTPAA